MPITSLQRHGRSKETDGTVCFPYISLTDGLPKAAANELVVYAPERSCAEVLLDTVDLYLAESLSEDAKKDAISGWLISVEAWKYSAKRPCRQSQTTTAVTTTKRIQTTSPKSPAARWRIGGEIIF